MHTPSSPDAGPVPRMLVGRVTLTLYPFTLGAAPTKVFFRFLPSHQCWQGLEVTRRALCLRGSVAAAPFDLRPALRQRSQGSIWHPRQI